MKSPGLCVWLTGLPSSGKSTISCGVANRLSQDEVPSTLLDGDELRERLGALGFSREDRRRNVQRAAWIASMVVKHSGIVLCSLVSPYEEERASAAMMIGGDNFILVHVNAPVEVCAKRDKKDLYRRALDGEIGNMTGVNDPYEDPVKPNIKLNTEFLKPETCIDIVYNLVVSKCRRKGIHYEDY